MLDPASYMQFAGWISHHGSLPIPQDAAAFGHATRVTYASAAFYQVGSNIVPQFMAGLPMLLSLGFWAGGARLAVFMGPLFGALAVLTFAGLVARLVGPRWAPLGALAIGITIPEQFVSRGTFSEPLAQILFLGALSLWIDVQRTDRGAGGRGTLAEQLADALAVGLPLARVHHRTAVRHHAARPHRRAERQPARPPVLRLADPAAAAAGHPADRRNGHRHGLRHRGRRVPDPAVPEDQLAVGQVHGRRGGPGCPGHGRGGLVVPAAGRGVPLHRRARGSSRPRRRCRSW